eukprot:1152443-Pelagomonas_calceolata.AAC.3
MLACAGMDAPACAFIEDRIKTLVHINTCTPHCCREYSKQLNEQRIKVLVARENAIQVSVCGAGCA